MTKTVLIIEDEFLIAAEMEAVIQDLGYQSAGIADTMESALEKASDRIDVALIDVNLADGATGPSIGAQLAADYNIEVVFVTANPGQLGDGICGAVGALEKPIEVTILKEALDYVIGLRRGEDRDPPARLRLFDSA